MAPTRRRAGVSATAPNKLSRMSYAFQPGESIDRAVRRIAGRCLDRACQALEGETVSPGEDPVFTARKEIKKFRALLQLFGKSLRPKFCKAERDLMRSAASCLSDIRDRAVEEKVLREFLARAGGFAWRGSAPKMGAGVRKKAVSRAARAMKRAAKRNRKKEFKEASWRAFSTGAKENYREGRSAFRKLQSNAGAGELHRWRKDVKGLSYALRLVETLRPVALHAKLELAKRLGRALGEHHDLALVRARLKEANGQIPASVMTKIERVWRSSWNESRRLALLLGMQLYSSKPKQFQAELNRAWKLSRKK